MEHWRPLEEERWTFLKEHSTLDPCLLNMHALELDIVVEIEHSTCGPILCRVRLLVMDKVHFLLLASLTFYINKGRKESFDHTHSCSLM